ncbi:MAG: thioredoxin domain-containing protein [Candidatus Bathyarchaeota archaeon]|nr:thioredoxin domain-containing protein [Candidatus Bathyarchaeota archaeon]
MPDVTKELAITRMDCPTCVVTLEKSVMKVPGVTKAQGNYLKKTIKVTMSDSTPLAAVEKAIEDVGYQVAYKKYPGPLSKLRGLFSRGDSKAITAITDGDFTAKVLEAAKPVAVLFSSEGCPSCQVLKPQIKALAEKQAGKVNFYEMDVTHTEAWKQYNVMGIPTVIVFRGGKSAERFGAMLRVDELEKTLA